MNAESTAPVCYLVDREPGIRRLVASALESFKIDVKLFDTLADMMGVPWTREPDLVFLDVTVGGSEGVEMIDRLAETGAKYPIQILSGLNPVLVEQIRRCRSGPWCPRGRGRRSSPASCGRGRSGNRARRRCSRGP